MRPEQISLPNKLPNRERDADRLRDDLARHPLMIGELAAMGGGRSNGILLHHGTDDLIKMEQQIPPPRYGSLSGVNTTDIASESITNPSVRQTLRLNCGHSRTSPGEPYKRVTSLVCYINICLPNAQVQPRRAAARNTN